MQIICTATCFSTRKAQTTTTLTHSGKVFLEHLSGLSSVPRLFARMFVCHTNCKTKRAAFLHDCLMHVRSGTRARFIMRVRYVGTAGHDCLQEVRCPLWFARVNSGCTTTIRQNSVEKQYILQKETTLTALKNLQASVHESTSCCFGIARHGTSCPFHAGPFHDILLEPSHNGGFASSRNLSVLTN